MPSPDRPNPPRSNLERTQATRHALLEAARVLFVDKGYADTSTPEVSAAAGTTRGALYHHFVDKRDLFRHLLLREAQAVKAEILAASADDPSPRQALIDGAQAYLQAMTVPGRTRLMLIDGPAVLGLGDATAIDDDNAADTLREGLAAALDRAPAEIDALAKLLSAAFDRAALEIDAGAEPQAISESMLWLLRRVLGDDDEAVD
ncbi:TetR/AcrR family transcriptional regulator [Lysobacter capsici]|uniref:TetR/AcrR family transcriptional regulator n=1 Tax=Lysobacter capsici TaxID=435897 RepID=UPI001BFFEB4F|nr:TetR/AcrR family transcriptional regulator [Lysobacter capsici]QWF15065.1 TetR/AcrR family transcriptional regulator [Lysobacter capsici]